ncbi:hypothetical protein GCM10010381_04540 [Streptomyces xantholiticus]|nr:hypothetical protein GCM10010381_04540 [Streptomyces xantholiticus]
MDTKPASPPRRPYEAARAACDVVEVLEVVWERCRDTASLPVSTSQLRVLYALEREDGINLRTLGEMLGSIPWKRAACPGRSWPNPPRGAWRCVG